MTAAAIPDHFCASLCDEMQGMNTAPGTGEMNGDEFIARLQKNNLFLIALDPENRWFRYHHLFRQLLQDRLNRHWRSEEIKALHSRAKAWFVEYEPTRDTIKDSDTPPRPITPSPRSSAPPSLVEPLTNRELDVLDLLARRLSNQEIADKLFISVTTVKSHIHNIYGKLNVGKRREAVEKARELGIH